MTKFGNPEFSTLFQQLNRNVQNLHVGMLFFLHHLAHELLVSALDIALIDNGIPHCGINLRMAQYFLNLFYWHALINRASCHSSSELMRMDTRKIQLSSQSPQTYLHAADFEPSVWRGQGNK